MSAAMVHADIYKSVDADGRVTYSNIPSKGAKRMDLDNISTVPGHRNGSTPTPPDFPRVDANTQKSRDNIRRQILNEELAHEQKLLAASNAVYNNGSPALLPGEQSASPKYRERIAQAKRDIATHEKNILALQQELAQIK